MFKIDEYKTLLKQRLTESRYEHSLCVADEIVRLAKMYGGDVEKCYIAGLLHDVMKNAPAEEHLKIFSQFGIILSDVEKNAKKLWHAMSGALYVESLLDIDDKEIIDAIRYHTTARANMTQLDKLLYIADFTSADRDYDDVDVMRSLANKDLNDALKYALSYSIIDLVKNEKPVHPDTVAAFNEMNL